MYLKPVVAMLAVMLCSNGPRELGDQPVTVFRGVPSQKVTTEGTQSHVERLATQSAGNLQVVISRIGDRYYWASRENVEMVRSDGGAFITYIAVTGAGYVRVLNPQFKEAAGVFGETERSFDYTEHIVVGLRSISYYGSLRTIVP